MAETLHRGPSSTAACVLAFASAVVGLHLLSLYRWTGTLWGVHAWAFLPVWVQVTTLALVVVAAVPLTRWTLAGLSLTRGERHRARTAGADSGSEALEATPVLPLRGPEPRASVAGPSSRARPIALGTLAAAAGGVLLWVLRARHNLLGDGVAIVAGGPGTGGLHELEPLTVLIQARALDLLNALSGPGHSGQQLTWNAVALVSVVAGALFIPVAWAIAGEIGAMDGGERPAPDASSPPGAAATTRWTVALIFVILVSQGYLQLFCGYVENYALLALANAIVVLTGLRFARGRGSLLAAGAAMVLAISIHLSASALIPAWSLLALWGVWFGTNRRRHAIDLALTVLLGAALTLALARLKPGYLLPRALWDVTVRAVGQRQEDPAYLLSLRHVRDFFNEQMLIGPLGIFAFAGGLGLALARGSWRRPDALFAAVAGLGYAGACMVAGDSNLGYARNWDLLAPAGVVFTVAGLQLLRPAFQTAAPWRSALLLAVALSVFHTLPWIALNASERRSVERFTTLPLGGGRTENTVALWYAERGDFAEAKRWLKRSLRVNPENSRALDLYGRIAFDEHEPRLALEAYLIAVTIRPDKAEYRQQLAAAVAACGGPAIGLAKIDTLMAGREDNGALWLERAMLLRACGRRAESAEAKSRAVELWPALASMADSLPAPPPR